MKTPWTGAVVCVAGIIIASWIFFVVDWNESEVARDKMLLELFKFAITTVLVGGAALVYDAFVKRAEINRKKIEEMRNRSLADAEKERAKNEERLEKARLELAEEQRRIEALDAARRRSLEEFFREVTSVYNDLKFIRRELRNALHMNEDNPYTIEKVRYAELLRDLNRGQLKLEQFRRILDARPAYLSFYGKKGAKLLSSAESYLRKVTREYEYRELETPDHKDSLLLAPPKSRLFQYAASSKNEEHDGTVFDKFFDPLDEFFSELASKIDAEQVRKEPIRLPQVS